LLNINLLSSPLRAISEHAKGNMLMKNTSEEKNKEPWGILSCIDLYDCNPETIRDAAKIKQFVAELCVLIDMKRFGETTVVNFGEDEKVAGFSMTQLIETSLISAHFANKTNTTYLDVFSCKYYDSEQAANFAKKFFGAKEVRFQVINRR
jgi:S-adenosylmethionine/arginine decarboxylase-like enzyme